MVATQSLLLRCTGLSKTFRTSGIEVRAVDDVSLDVRSGEILFVCGPNGSGKTTLLKLIAGTEDIDPAGQISVMVDGVTAPWASSREMSFRWIPQHIQDILAESLRVDELVSLADVRRVMTLARTIEAQWLIDCVKQRSGRKLVGELSGGQRQLLVGIVALSPPRPVLLLDEIFTSMDDSARSAYWRMLQESVGASQGCAIIVSHDLAFALQHSTRILVLRGGRVALDAPSSGLSLKDVAYEVARIV